MAGVDFRRSRDFTLFTSWFYAWVQNVITDGRWDLYFTWVQLLHFTFRVLRPRGDEWSLRAFASMPSTARVALGTRMNVWQKAENNILLMRKWHHSFLLLAIAVAWKWQIAWWFRISDKTIIRERYNNWFIDPLFHFTVKVGQAYPLKILLMNWLFEKSESVSRSRY